MTLAVANQIEGRWQDRRWMGFAALILVIANAMTLLSGWFDVAGVLILGILLPGALAAAWLLRRTFPPLLEYVAYSLGLGFSLYVVTMLLITNLPGPLYYWHVLAALDALCIALGIGTWRAQRTPIVPLAETTLRAGSPPSLLASSGDAADQESIKTPHQNRWAWIGLVSVLLVAALLRFPNLGYSDFLGDEARAMLYATDAIQGYPSALLVHKKGPTEILIPLGIYTVAGQITEAQARFPFALAGMLGIFALYLLGWRMFGAVAGWLAAMLLAMDGYFIGFARIVQYQSIVFCMTLLIVLALYHQARARRPLPAYLWMAGLFLVGSLYAHYEAIWVLIPGLYLLYVYGQRTHDFMGLLRALLVPALVTIALVALFYVPFVLDAHWAETATYLFDHRISNAFPYNGLQEFFERSLIYDSIYAFLFLVVMTVISQIIVLRKVWPTWIVSLVAALTVAGLAITFWVRPNWLVIGGTDHTWLFFALAALIVIVPRRVQHEERMVWLWFGVAMVVSLFFVAKPNTHVYGFFLPWALVVGLAGEAIWRGLRRAVGLQGARMVALPVSVILIAIFGYYTYRIFTYTDVEIFRTWTTNRPAGYWTPFEIPTRGDLFGLPYKNGWKVVGALYADGTLDAPFDSNESNRVADWYSRGLYFCPTDAEYYMLPTTQQPREAVNDAAKVGELTAAGFHPWGVITVAGDERMRIFTNQPGDAPLHVFEEGDYASLFDTTLTSPIFVKRGPTMIVQPANPVNYRFGEGMWLKGYTVSQSQVAPGERLQLQLFWEATTPLRRGDKTSIQLIDLDTTRKAAQRDGEPGCGVYHLGEWRPGDLNLDPYTLTVAPDTPPGSYTFLISVYDQDTTDHYPLFAPDGTPIGDSLPLATVEVVAP
jgi:hypothetical protein